MPDDLNAKYDRFYTELRAHRDAIKARQFRSAVIDHVPIGPVVINEADFFRISPDNNPAAWFDHAYHPYPITWRDFPFFILEVMNRKGIMFSDWPNTYDSDQSWWEEHWYIGV